MRVLSLTVLLLACQSSHPPSSGATTTTAVGSAPHEAQQTTTKASSGLAPAPDFTLSDVDGKAVTLSQYKGKIVVLEWFNPNCPFVRRNHTLGPLKDMAARVQKQGVVWLSVNSNAKGKEGNGVEANKAGIAKYAMQNPVLLDEDGKVGHAYGANHTPHMFVIDAQGNIAYRGAIDNAPDGDTDLSAPFVNYVDAALADLAAARPVAKPETPAYGCTVKYAN
jgi:peroxiredoxin